MPPPPNILFLFTDQQRHDTIRALGNDIIRTPVLDRLVREGTSFSRGYTPSPVCVAARSSLMTGLPPHINGCTDNSPLPQPRPSIIEHLRSTGYQTHGVGKMHFLPDHTAPWGFESRDISEEIEEEKNDYLAFIRAHGFGHVHEPHGVRSEYYYIPQPSQLPANLHESSWVADRSIDFLKRRDLARPFFLWSSFIKPHPPFDPPTPWSKLYRSADMPKPFRPENCEDLLTFWNRVQNRYKYKDAGTDDLLLRTMRAAYYASISFIDFNIGRILEMLGDEIDNTLVAFSSDHGELLGDYGSFGKRSMLDASARIPFLIRWPEHVPAGKTCATPVSLLDLWPTFAVAAGETQPPPYSYSRDIVEISNGPSRPREITSQFSEGRFGIYMITDGDWKYVYSSPDRREWLFDLKNDPLETRSFETEGTAAPHLHRLRTSLISRLREEGATAAVEGETWREYPPGRFPAAPDAGLLFQDPPSSQAAVEQLGPYATGFPIPPPPSFQVFKK